MVLFAYTTQFTTELLLLRDNNHTRTVILKRTKIIIPIYLFHGKPRRFKQKLNLASLEEVELRATNGAPHRLALYVLVVKMRQLEQVRRCRRCRTDEMGQQRAIIHRPRSL